MVGVVVEVEPSQHLLDAGGGLDLARGPAPQPEGDVLADGRHDDLGVGVGEAEPDLAAHRATLAPGVQAVDRDRAPGGEDQAVQEPRERGLPRSVGADHAAPSLVEPHADVLEHDAAPSVLAVAVRHLRDLDHRSASTTTATPWPPPAAMAARP